MSHLPAAVPEGFAILSKREKIEYIQGLWDRLADDPSEIPVRESHLIVAEERLAEYKKNPEMAAPAHEVLDRLANRRK